jgi:hypothetical protein
MPDPTSVILAKSAFVPIAVGFFGLGVGYLIYGPQELFGFPARSRAVDIGSGIWGIWMPGFLQFLAGTYLFVGLSWLGSFTAPPLYMAALAFTAFGVHWWAIGLSRALGGDGRLNGLMSIPFIVLSVLGVVVFFTAGDWPVGLVFIGLTGVYVFDFFASLFPGAVGRLGDVGLGLFRLATGAWLMYMTWAVTVDTALGYKLPT